MDATPTGLADSARCYTCLSSHQKMAAITYLMAIWAGVNPDPVALAQAATPYRSIPTRLLRGILTWGTLVYLVPSGTPPILLSISPSPRVSGSAANMTVTGTGFLTGGSTVTVAGLALGENVDFSQDSSTQLTVFGTKLASIPLGTYDVTYANINGTSTLHNALSVVNQWQSITPSTTSHLVPIALHITGVGFSTLNVQFIIAKVGSTLYHGWQLNHSPNGFTIDSDTQISIPDNSGDPLHTFLFTPANTFSFFWSVDGVTYFDTGLTITST